MAGKVYSLLEVARHNTEQDCWIVINGNVYDVTKFLSLHPGGRRTIVALAGTDASSEFAPLHSDGVLKRWGPRLLVGQLDKQSGKRKRRRKKHEYGDLIPFADPHWYQGLKSPHYKDTHVRFRHLVRSFVDRELIPYVGKWDEEGTYPPDLHEKAYAAGVYGAMWPREWGGTPPEEGGGDVFHDFILWDEICRCGSGGLVAAVFLSAAIALPPIIAVGSKEIKDKVCRDVITGKKIICLAITEPYAGSDVANLQTTAVQEGQQWVVSGEKKFITSGMKADFFVVACRTGKRGMMGVSLLLLEKGMVGLKARRQKTQGWWSSNTAFLTFDRVKVPLSNLIGQLNMGFLPIMVQFNHERFVGMVGSNRASRICLEDSIKHATQRRTFGRKLINHQVIRHKLAEMARRIESTHALSESIAYQMQHNVDPKRIGALTALGKVNATKNLEFCAREACQILGGVSFIRGGVGERIERIYREVRVQAIGGGSEEVMMELAMRQSKL